MTLAQELLSVALSYQAGGCYVDAWARDDDVLRRLTEARPASRVTWYGKGPGDFPAQVRLGVPAFEEAASALRAWADITRCYVLWHDMTWPAVPELGLDPEYKYAELEVACHSHDIHCEEWTAEHTVFVHARPGHDDRAAWLAARVGARVVGPAEFGW
ncbi:hypothetical protein OG875_25665 [Streptomyces sp. NBC_01498]|uniref:hypothetical protein n=1 Tax=Streptomyces sp. NBC_01498 TaxID=2975870 RepID=UPI002E7BA760|nr:hypothetical protein [Streptomyces sp. NBC_01498]WTL27659.1 hypothetical protein OG875_25665 [Streptomyces sp. NBC_01498]